MFTATWCGPCQRTKAEIAELVKAGWTTSEWPDQSGTIILVDSDKFPAESTKFNVTALPTLIRVDRVSFTETNRRTGYSTRWQIGDLYYQK